MIRFLILSAVCVAVSAVKATVPEFEVEVQALRIPAITAAKPDGTGGVVEATILGKFYPLDALPVIRAENAQVDSDASPYALLSSYLHLAEAGGVDALPVLYSPASQPIIAGLLADAVQRQQTVEWLKGLRQFAVLGGWALAPNRYIVYVRVNGEETGAMPFLFEWTGERWYLEAGALNAPLSARLDPLYFRPGGGQVEIISPPAPEAVSALLAQEGMAEFAARLGFVPVLKD